MKQPECVYVCVCSKPVKRGELLARIKAHLRVKSDATWVQSIVKGVLTEDSEAMKILESILPESIISRIQVSFSQRQARANYELLLHQNLHLSSLAKSYHVSVSFCTWSLSEWR